MSEDLRLELMSDDEYLEAMIQLALDKQFKKEGAKSE